MRFLVLRLPAFPLERCGYDAGDLAATVDVVRSATRIVALTPRAREAGLYIGATATEARALVPDVVLVPFDASGEAHDRAELLRAFDGLSDRVACGVGGGAGWEDTLVLEISNLPQEQGSLGLGDPEKVLGHRALERATALGHAAKTAIADNPFAARAAADGLAGLGEVVVLPVGSSAAHLAPLPVAVLFPSEALHGSFDAIGVDTVGRFAALDPAAVAGRYGAEGARLHRIARGDASWVGIPPAVDEAHPAAWAILAGATTRQELAFVLPGLAHELALRLEARSLAAVRLRIALSMESTSVGSARSEVTVRTGRPTRSPAALERIVRQRIERIEVSAPIEAIGLEVVHAVPEFGWQPGLADRTEASEAIPDLLARLIDQFGEGALFAPSIHSDWRPEHAWVRRPFRPGGSDRVVEKPDSDPVTALEAWERADPLPRPVLLLPDPQRLEVVVADGCPQKARVGEVAKRWCIVERCQGPERLMGVWWEPEFLDRTYWALQVDHRGLWVFQDRRGWWLHGYFD